MLHGKTGRQKERFYQKLEKLWTGKSSQRKGRFLQMGRMLSVRIQNAKRLQITEVDASANGDNPRNKSITGVHIYIYLWRPSALSLFLARCTCLTCSSVEWNLFGKTWLIIICLQSHWLANQKLKRSPLTAERSGHDCLASVPLSFLVIWLSHYGHGSAVSGQPLQRSMFLACSTAQAMCASTCYCNLFRHVEFQLASSSSLRTGKSLNG